MKEQIPDSEFNLQKLYITISNYKVLIIMLMLSSTLIMATKLYFTSSTYASKSILEIKSKSKPKMPNDILLSALSFGTGGKVEKEIELLKTFLINQKALEQIDFSVKYFKKKNYKDIELYNSSPFKVSVVQIYNQNVKGKEIILTPHANHFTLSVKNSLKDYLIGLFSPKYYIKLDTTQKYAYGKTIKNDFFELHIQKNEDFTEKIKFILTGSQREIYNDIIQKQLIVQQINPNAPLIEISFEDTIPQRANEYIDTLTTSLIDINIETKNTQNNKILTFINQELKKNKDILQSSEDKLEAYKSTHKIIEPSIQAKKYIEKLSELEIKLSENILKQKLITNLLLFSRNNNNLDAIAPSIMELNDKPTLQLITTLQSLQIKESNLKTELTDRHPKLITVRQQIHNIRQKIIYNLKNLKSLIFSKKRSLISEKTSYAKKIENLPKEEKNIVNISRNYKVNSNMYNYLLKKKTESELLVISTLSDYKVIDKAYTNIKPIKPKKTLLLLVSPLIGLLFGIILSTILQGLNKKIASYQELEKKTNLPILGLIPEITKSLVKRELYENPHSRFTESFRALRSNIIQQKAEEEAKIILLSSTIAGEGKTTVTSNLASICQTAGHKVIILSLDLRKPTLHKCFDLENEKGISTYLTGEDSIQEIIFATKHTNLHVITSGPIPQNPSELLLSTRLIELIDILKSRYDYIFIDTAPIGLVSDNIQLMQLSDQNIIILRENYSEEYFLESLNNIIKKHQLNNIGLVLNSTKSKTKSYGYGYGYGYGK